MGWAAQRARDLEEWAILVVLAVGVTEEGLARTPLREMAAIAHMSERTVRRRLAGLVSAGIISMEEAASGRRPATYRLPDLTASQVYGARPVQQTGLVDRSTGPGSGSPVYESPLRVVEGTDSPVYDPSYVVGGETSSSDDALQEHHVEVGPAALDLASTEGQDSSITSEAGVTSRHTEGIPWTEVHLLRTWFGIEQIEAVQAWQAAWATAVSVASDYDPQANLVSYLTRCREQDRRPQPGLWLKFLIEDRQKFKLTMSETARRLEQEQAADGGEGWALRSLTATPDWSGVGKGDGTQ
jgi:DNA-binding Lrp family transcriptional regulator